MLPLPLRLSPRSFTTAAALAVSLAAPLALATTYNGAVTRVGANLYEGQSGDVIIVTRQCASPAIASASTLRIDTNAGPVLGLLTFADASSCEVTATYGYYTDATTDPVPATLALLDANYFLDEAQHLLVRSANCAFASPASSATVAATSAGRSYRGGAAFGSITFASPATVCDLVGLYGRVNLTGADLGITQSLPPGTVRTGRDVAITLDVRNAGPDTAIGVTVRDVLPAGVAFVWASPGCTHAAGTVSCNVGALAKDASAFLKVVVRPVAAALFAHTVSVTAAVDEVDAADNTSTLAFSAIASPAGAQALRYRLFSPVTREHHFTTDLNEYNVLGSFVGTWVQEGTVGKVLDGPGAYNGVEAIPYYRLYNTSNHQHHWTTDPNEYYTLGLFPQYTCEGVDGWIFPTQAAGTIPLYRLMYPYSVPVAGLHHWTIDAIEYDALIATYGWVGEGGSGFVIP